MAEPYPVQIGSQLFINRGDPPERIRAWVRQMREANLRLIRLFITWDLIEPEQGIWDFRQYDAVFEEAEMLGMGVVPTLSANSAPGWVKLALGFESQFDIDSPTIWALGLAQVRRVVDRYHASPALHSWILWNEPGYQVIRNENGQLAYTAYLSRTYRPDINALNAVYEKHYQTFEEAGEDLTYITDYAEFSPYPERLDWIRFSVDHLMEKLGDIKAEIRRIDADHPVHVNPHDVTSCILPSGQSIWEEAKVVDFLGCSSHPSWHSTRFPPDRLHQSVAMFADLMKSATPHPAGLFWVTELQGGTNIFSGVTYLCPTPGELRQWMWESIGAGAKAVVFWCFNTRDGGFEAGEWGLLDQRGQPSERLLAAQEVARLVEEHQDLFDQAQPAPADVWILHSEHTGALALIEGSGDPGVSNPRNKQMASDALCGAYLMCADLGLNVQFINEERLAREGLPAGAALLLPGATALDPATCLAVERHAASGGLVIADGLCGYKNPNGHISLENRACFDRLFGAPLEDIQASREFDIQHEGAQQPIAGWFLRCILAETSEASVTGRFADGRPAVVRRQVNGGAAVRIGTVFFQRYFSRPEPQPREFLLSLLPPLNSPVILENGGFDLRLKRLLVEDGALLILLNAGGQRVAVLRFDQGGQLTGLNREIHQALRPGDRVEISIPAGDVTLLRYQAG